MKFLNGGLFQSGGGLNYIPGIVTWYASDPKFQIDPKYILFT
jgi:hypothetical protein